MNRKKRVLMSERQYRQFRRFLREGTSGGVLKLGSRKVIYFESGMDISTSGVIFNFKEMRKVKDNKINPYISEQFSIGFEVSFFFKNRGSIVSSYEGEIVYEVPKNEWLDAFGDKAKDIYDFEGIEYISLQIFEENMDLNELILQNLRTSKSSKSGRYVSGSKYGRAVGDTHYAHEIMNEFYELSGEEIKKGLSGFYHGGDYRTFKNH